MHTDPKRLASQHRTRANSKLNRPTIPLREQIAGDFDPTPNTTTHNHSTPTSNQPSNSRPRPIMPKLATKPEHPQQHPAKQLKATPDIA